MIVQLLHSVHWMRPHLLWLLLVLPLLGAWAWRRGRSAPALAKVVDAHLLPHLLAAQPRRLGGWPWALLLGTTLAIVALAGPGWQKQAQPLWQTQSPLVLLLDLSTRSTTTDLPPSRLLQARAKLARLLAMREGGQVALVVYAQDAYTVAPLTDDTANIALYLDALSPTVMPADGHDTARGLAWATELLQRSGAQRGQILLLTDSADDAAIAAAGQAAAQGMRVSVLGLGTPTGAPFRDGRGQIATAALDEASLRRLVAAGDGRYQRVASDDADLRALDVLRADDGAGHQDSQATALWQDQGYWLLPPLMLLALLAFRRRSGLLAVLLVVALWPPQTSWAAAPASTSAAPVRGSFWQRADQRQHERLAQGVQAYRSGDATAAAELFSGNDSADGWYNLGNARARQGDYDGALQAYDRALSRQPGMPDALANRAVVEAARKRQPPAGKQDKPGQQGKSQQANVGQGQPSGQGDRAQDQARQGQPQQGQPVPGQPPGANRQQGTPPPSAADAQAQAQADAAQRQRMQQAMQQQGQGSAAQGRAADEAAMTPQQREQRQAVEAWMRRVPDEPGNLLRAKFQLENERRKREGR